MKTTHTKILLLAGMCINLQLLSADDGKLSPQETVLTAILTAGPFKDVPLSPKTMNQLVAAYMAEERQLVPRRNFALWSEFYSRKLELRFNFTQHQTDWVLLNARMQQMSNQQLDAVIKLAPPILAANPDDYKKE